MAHYVAKRLGFKITRGWFTLFIILSALVGAAFWIGPFRARPADLQLFALSGDGRFREFVGIPSAWADTLPPASEATARFPIILAVHNAGAVGASPNRLSLSLPSRFRVTDSHGQPLQFTATMGNPLVRYELPLRGQPIPPGGVPSIIAGLDTIWLEPVVPTIYCTALSDSVPEFVSAPAINPQLLSRVRVFYSFDGERIRQRQTGLITIQVDPNLVKRDPAPNPPIFPTAVLKPEAPRPEMGALRYIGERTTWCGDPGQPMEVFDVLWETLEGGRFFVLYNGGAPRKYLFDLNRDSIVELEMWDQDGDGKFESRRPARMAIPSFLMPFVAPVPDSIAADSLAMDSVTASVDTVATSPQWLDLFYDTGKGPLRFAPSGDTASRAPATRPTPAPTPAVTPGAAAPATVTPPITQPAAGRPVRRIEVDSTKLRLFYDTGAGPMRFKRALDAARAPRPRPRRETGPPLLGVPVEEARRPRPDTSRR